MVGDDWSSLFPAFNGLRFADVEAGLLLAKSELEPEAFSSLIDEAAEWVLNERFHRFQFPLHRFLEILAEIDPTGDPERRRQATLPFAEREAAAASAREAVRRRRAEEVARKEAEKQAEVEQQRAEREQERLRREGAFEQLRQHLESDFLEADRLSVHGYQNVLSDQDVQAEKIAFVERWYEARLLTEGGAVRNLPDPTQCAAIGAVNGNVQVVARAGSGKTSTVVDRAEFLTRHCRVPSDQIMILAFNRNAAHEVRRRLLVGLYPDAERLIVAERKRREQEQRGRGASLRDLDEAATDSVIKQIQAELPHVMTFHALAYGVVHPEESILSDGPDQESQGLSRVIQQVVDDHLRSDVHFEAIRRVMLAHFREDWDRIIEGRFADSPREFLQFRKSLARQSLAGDYLKSGGEKLIADFLFEHGVPYKYEQNHWWSGINYRPDFTIPTSEKGGVVIEYFGLSGDRDYDEMSENKRRYWGSKAGWELIEFSPYDIALNGAEAFLAELRGRLEACGVTCRRLSEQEIWNLIKDRAIDDFTRAIKGFIARCRKLLISPNQLGAMIGERGGAPTALQGFWMLASRLYAAYLERLVATGEEDFDGLMQRATQTILTGKTAFARKTRSGDLRKITHLFIDEYQDFSELFHRLISAIRGQNAAVELFCVGDDWQAINGFAGSDLRFFKNFNAFVPGQNRRVVLDRNYRSCRSVVQTGNAVMDGLGEPAIAHRIDPGRVQIGDLADFRPTLREVDMHRGDDITPAVLRLVRWFLSDGKKVVLLSRQKSLPYYISQSSGRAAGEGGLEHFLRHIRSWLPEPVRDNVMISTAHSFKGREAPVVILLDALARRFPLIHPDWVFSEILGDNPSIITDEERRLFYVAVTRAKDELVIVTRKGEESPFMTGFSRGDLTSRVVWDNLPDTAPSAANVIIMVGNGFGWGAAPTHEIKDLLKAHGYAWRSVGWPSWWKSVPAAGFSLDRVKSEPWAARADGIEVRVDGANENGVERYLVSHGYWETAGLL